MIEILSCILETFVGRMCHEAAAQVVFGLAALVPVIGDISGPSR